MLACLLFSTNCYAKQFIECDKNGNVISGAQTFTKAQIDVTNYYGDAKTQENYYYYGLDVCVVDLSSPLAEDGGRHPEYIERVVTYDSKVLLDLGSNSSAYQDGKVYVLAYRILYRPNGCVHNPIVEGEWQKSYFTVTGSSNYKDFDYIYEPISSHINVDMDTLFTYKSNKITVETSSYVTKVHIKFAQKYTAELNRDQTWDLLDPDGNSIKSTDWIYNDTGNCLKVDDTGANGLKWIFVFKLKNYSIYKDPPKPDYAQFDTLQITALDHNNNKVEAGFLSGEINPKYYTVNVRQSKLFNLRITDVNDIYWKHVFNELKTQNNKSVYVAKAYTDLQDGKTTAPPFGLKKMPLSSNPISNKRLISKGYAVKFEIDSEGFNRTDDVTKDKITVTPTFWWYGSTKNDPTEKFRRVDLYYDIPNKIIDINNGIGNKVTRNGIYLVPIDEDSARCQEKINKIVEYLFPTSNNTCTDTQQANIKKYYKDNCVDDYNKLTFNAKNKYLSAGGTKYLKSGRSTWRFIDNTVANITDNYYKKFGSYRNTWTFTYSLHPETRAFLRDNSGNWVNPATNEGKQYEVHGAILVNFEIKGYNGYDSMEYNYTQLEDGWNQTSPLNFDAGNGSGHGNTFYFNLDWSALKDYSTQQKW